MGLLLTLAAVCASPACLLAQSRLYAFDGDTANVVRSADGIYPYVMGPSGKLVKSGATVFGLQRVPEYLPLIVEVRDVKVQTHYTSFGASADRLNNELQFMATLVSPVTLDRAFVVLDLSLDQSGKSVFLWGIGRMEAGKPVPLALAVPTPREMGSGHYNLHVFTDGVEVFNTMMGPLNIDGCLDAMVYKRISGVTDGKPAPLLATFPTYPRDLKKKGVKGSAVVKVRIDNRGRVLDQTLVSATDPAFGASALASVKDWRFVPRVKEGRPVETIVTIPFSFDPSA
jgi:TonB family protein